MKKRLLAFLLVDFMGVFIFLSIPSLLIMNHTPSLDINPDWNIFTNWYIYMIIKDCIKGKSLGKLLFKLQVIDCKTGKPANPLKCIIRNLFYVGPIDILIMIYQSQNRRLGDYITNTIVIDTHNK